MSQIPDICCYQARLKTPVSEYASGCHVRTTVVRVLLRFPLLRSKRAAVFFERMPSGVVWVRSNEKLGETCLSLFSRRMDSMEPETLAGEADPEPTQASTCSVAEAANEVSKVDQTDLHTRLPLLEDNNRPKVIHRTVATNLLEVFSVRFVDFRKHDLKNMYGCLLLSACPPYVIFSRKFGDPLYTDAWGSVKLRGPDITTIPSDFTFIVPQLFSYQACADQFEEIDCDPIWDIYFQQIFDRLLTRRVPTQFGEIEVNFAVYMYAIEACIDVTLIDCKFSPATVHGSITAQNSKLGDKGTSFLFKRDKGDGVSINISDCKDRIAQLPLARCKTVHPIDSLLTIYVSICQSSFTGTQDQPIADKRRLEFTAIFGEQVVKTIKGAGCQVNVGVTWPEVSQRHLGNRFYG